MPYLSVGEDVHRADIYYEVHGDSGAPKEGAGQAEQPSIVMLMGFAATLDCWAPQLEELLKPHEVPDQPPARILLLDNRGVGRSSSPQPKKAYSTTLMAKDVIALLEHLRWEYVHLVGHSMGGMVACKLASLVPERVTSLIIISSTEGGWQSIPRSWKAIKYGFKALRAKTLEARAKVDLKFHFMKKTLREVDNRYGRTRKELLHEEYVETSKGAAVGQPPHGFQGQLHAVWHHSVSQQDLNNIRGGRFPVLVIHGRHDMLAMPYYAERLAHKLEAACVMLEGAHFLTRERGPEVNMLLKLVILHGSRIYANPTRYLDRVSPRQAAVEAQVVQLQVTQ
ncbi:hypothetical protein WJX72_004920 [[Myrmecia] bisecta]|uniref:AB hydrolase-1 domain-containing protein n=1 Tax=[Myrmecia] bisecta TaxID=41462 RepID=A0AAW1QEZ6_9CHLO